MKNKMRKRIVLGIAILGLGMGVMNGGVQEVKAANINNPNIIKKTPSYRERIDEYEFFTFIQSQYKEGKLCKFQKYFTFFDRVNTIENNDEGFDDNQYKEFVKVIETQMSVHEVLRLREMWVNNYLTLMKDVETPQGLADYSKQEQQDKEQMNKAVEEGHKLDNQKHSEKKVSVKATDADWCDKEGYVDYCGDFSNLNNNLNLEINKDGYTVLPDGRLVNGLDIIENNDSNNHKNKTKVVVKGFKNKKVAKNVEVKQEKVLTTYGNKKLKPNKEMIRDKKVNNSNEKIINKQNNIIKEANQRLKDLDKEYTNEIKDNIKLIEENTKLTKKGGEVKEVVKTKIINKTDNTGWFVSFGVLGLLLVKEILVFLTKRNKR